MVGQGQIGVSVEAFCVTWQTLKGLWGLRLGRSGVVGLGGVALAVLGGCAADKAGEAELLPVTCVERRLEAGCSGGAEGGGYVFDFRTGACVRRSGGAVAVEPCLKRWKPAGGPVEKVADSLRAACLGCGAGWVLRGLGLSATLGPDLHAQVLDFQIFVDPVLGAFTA